MKRLSRPVRAAVTLAVLALPILAVAKEKLVISGMGLTFEVPCDSIKQTGGKPMTCAEICDKIDSAPLVSCRVENGRMIITDNNPVDTVMEGGEASLALAADTPIVVRTDEGTGTIHGFADHAIVGQVIDADGNPIVDLGYIQDFTVPLYDGERLQLTSPGEPAQLELWLDVSAAPATLSPAGGDTLSTGDAPAAALAVE